jgi:hypothetical protein
MSKKPEATELLTEIENGLKDKFLSVRKKHFNRNKKGYEYEKTLATFLESYLGGVYDFYVRVPLIDHELEALSILSVDENEFDVVATYKTAVPKIVLKAHDTSYIPYDAVAFVVEVKQKLDKTVLEDDLEKLDKLGKLKVGKRFGDHFTTKYSIQRPLKILFYYESGTTIDTLIASLNNKRNAWDFMVVLMDGDMFGNPSMPIVGKRYKIDKIVRKTNYPLLRLMLYATTSLPCPPIVNTWDLFLNLLSMLKD